MEGRRVQLTGLLCAALALGHALVTWPVGTTAVLYLGGGAIAFVLEVLGVRWGLVRHRLAPQVLGVPLVVVGIWPATVYAFTRLALLVTSEWMLAAGLAAALATLADLLGDPYFTARGLWAYPATPLSRVRYRGVPWWNFLAWVAVVFGTALLPPALGQVPG